MTISIDDKKSSAIISLNSISISIRYRGQLVYGPKKNLRCLRNKILFIFPIVHNCIFMYVDVLCAFLQLFFPSICIIMFIWCLLVFNYREIDFSLYFLKINKDDNIHNNEVEHTNINATLVDCQNFIYYIMRIVLGYFTDIHTTLP